MAQDTNIIANWTYPTAIKMGAGRISELPEACAAAGITKPLLVTDRGLAELPVTAETLDILSAAGLGRSIFSDVDPNPNEANLKAGIAAFNDGGHDGVIAFGGGSGLDLRESMLHTFFSSWMRVTPFRMKFTWVSRVAYPVVMFGC